MMFSVVLSLLVYFADASIIITGQENIVVSIDGENIQKVSTLPSIGIRIYHEISSCREVDFEGCEDDQIVYINDNYDATISASINLPAESSLKSVQMLKSA